MSGSIYFPVVLQYESIKEMWRSLCFHAFLLSLQIKKKTKNVSVVIKHNGFGEKKIKNVAQLLISDILTDVRELDDFLKTCVCCCCSCLFVTNLVVEEVKFQHGLYSSWTKRQNENQYSELLWISLYCLWEKWQTSLETFKKLRNIKNLHWFKILKARDRFKLRRLTVGYLLV